MKLAWFNTVQQAFTHGWMWIWFMSSMHVSLSMRDIMGWTRSPLKEVKNNLLDFYLFLFVYYYEKLATFMITQCFLMQFFNCKLIFLSWTSKHRNLLFQQCTAAQIVMGTHNDGSSLKLASNENSLFSKLLWIFFSLVTYAGQTSLVIYQIFTFIK